jgi:hypothetical protein
MTRTRLIVLFALVTAWPAGAYAQSDVIDWWNQLSGPGPFHNTLKGYELTGVCYPLNSFCWSNDGINLLDDTHKTDAKWLVKVGTTWASTGSQQLFQDDTADVRDVKELTISPFVMYRASPIVDVGAGFHFIRFSSDQGATFSFWRVGLVPGRLVVAPLGLINATGRARFARRLFRFQIEAVWLHEGFSGADFNNTKTKFSVGNEYQTRLAALIDGVAAYRLLTGQ